MKKFLLITLSLLTSLSLTACNDVESKTNELETVVEYLNANSSNYLIQTISDGCCQYTGAVDGSIIKREHTHFAYTEDGAVDYTTHKTCYYDVDNNQSHTMYTSNTTYSYDSDYKTTSSWTTDEKTDVTVPYLLSFDLCACCSEETSNNVFTFTITADEDKEVNKEYSTIKIDLTEGLESVVVTVIMSNGTTTYEISGFNTVDLEIPCLEDCTE